MCSPIGKIAGSASACVKSQNAKIIPIKINTNFDRSIIKKYLKLILNRKIQQNVN